MQLFDDEFDYRETANHKELTDYAVALFVGMISVPAVPSGGGGGSPMTCLGDGMKTRMKWNVPGGVPVQPLRNLVRNRNH